MSEEFYYAQVLKPQGDSRFLVEFLNGDEVSTTLKGELKKKKKGDVLKPYDWVKVLKTDIKISGTFYKIVERIGGDKDSEVKYLRKSGQLNRIEKTDNVKDESTEEISSNFHFKGKEKEEDVNERDDSWIDDIQIN